MRSRQPRNVPTETGNTVLRSCGTARLQVASKVAVWSIGIFSVFAEAKGDLREVVEGSVSGFLDPEAGA
jgi:hypothetical protein